MISSLLFTPSILANQLVTNFISPLYRETATKRVRKQRAEDNPLGPPDD